MDSNEATIYVECRQCDRCYHAGINDTDNSKAACTDCEWSGDSPVEDKCPSCQHEGTMTAACPKCGERYALVADAYLTTPQAAPAAVDDATAEPSVYSIDADPLGIRDRAAAAITGALGFGAQGVNPPPAGHWLMPFWQMARADAELQFIKPAPTGCDGLAALRAEQAEAVMPLIGPLLDVWERAHPDDLVGDSGLLDRLAAINAAMNDPEAALAAAQQEVRGG